MQTVPTVTFKRSTNIQRVTFKLCKWPQPNSKVLAITVFAGSSSDSQLETLNPLVVLHPIASVKGID